MHIDFLRLVCTIGLVHLIACEEKDEEVENVEIEVGDADQDGFAEGDDCDDNAADINPNATDSVGDDVDQNCDGIDGVDSDADGLASIESGGSDCDDSDAEEAASVGTTYYADADSDGFGDLDSPMVACDVPEGFVDNGDDCDDSTALANPSGEEICDGLDNDCDGAVDDDDDLVVGQSVSYTDSDGDGYGDASTEITSCEVPSSNADNGDDCNDGDATVNPMAEEIGADGLDQNCDGIEWCYEDADADGYGTELWVELTDDGSGYLDCSAATNMSDNWSDCDDIDSAVNPDALEVCDGGIDNDCNGYADDEDLNTDFSTGSLYFLDGDGDGYGSSEVQACEQGDLVTIDGDCNDSISVINPLSTDVSGDGTDQNCDGIDGTDSDGDGFASTSSGGVDCDDTDEIINPDAVEICDGGTDNDCDGLVDDADDSIDTTGTTLVYADMDGDTFGDPLMGFDSCGGATGYVTDSSDCDDSDPSTYPGAAYLQSTSDCQTDWDGDGWGSTSTPGDTCYAIDMEDDYGDGWNGSAIEVYEDGILMDTLTLTTGFSDSTEYCGTEGSAITFDFYTGSWVSEVGYLISDPSGTVLIEVLIGDASFSTNPVATDTVFVSSSASDCDDMDVDINPDALETCDGTDENCDGTVDEGVTTTYFADLDGDGFGDANSLVEACFEDVNLSSNSDDCDDLSSTAYPGTAEFDSIG